jgi:hypothetical protein
MPRAMPQDDREGRAVGGGRKGDQRDEGVALPAPQLVTGEHEQMYGEHGEAGEDVGEQNTGQPRQGGENGQGRRDAEEQQQPAAETERAQQQGQHPDRQRRLEHDHRPEIRRGENIQIEPEHGRAARHQIALEPAHQIAAGVELQQRKTVPDRRAKQNHGARHGGTDTRYAQHPRSPALPFPEVHIDRPR